MSKVGEVTEFIERIFHFYKIDKESFFYEFDDEDEDIIPMRKEIPLFPTGRINKKVLERIHTKIGFTPEELVSLDQQVLHKYSDKFPFFALYDAFICDANWSERYAGKRESAEEQLLRIIFDDPPESRYDLRSVKRKMIEMLEETEHYIPGTIHKNAEITNFRVVTETAFSFPRCSEMMDSFFQLIDYFKKQFFKAINENLAEDEVDEFNFLCASLDVSDIAWHSKKINYDYVKSVRRVLIDESYSDLFSYVRIEHELFDCEPWRCIEFLSDRKILEKYVSIFPTAKIMMREYLLLLENFRCEFVWSDVHPDFYDDNNSTVIYVKKTDEELAEGKDCIKLINSLIAPPSQGGISINPPEVEENHLLMLKRAQNRIFAKGVN